MSTTLGQSFVEFDKRRNKKSSSRVRAMGIPDIVTAVAGQLDIQDLASLSGVCVCYSGLARQELRIRTYHLLKSHISDWIPCAPSPICHPIFDETTTRSLSPPIVERIIDFLKMLRATRSVIAGSTALAALLSRSRAYSDYLDDCDLEIVTPKRKAIAVTLYLVEKEGYMVEQPEMGATGRPVLAMIPNFWRRCPSIKSITALVRQRDGSRAYVIESSNRTALTPVGQVANTIACNWLDMNGVSSAYPISTFRGYGTYNPSYCDNDVFDHGQFNFAQGFSVHGFKHSKRQCRKWWTYCPRRERRSEDSMTFRMALWPYDEGHASQSFDHFWSPSHHPRSLWVWGDWDNHATHDRPYVPSMYGVLQPWQTVCQVDPPLNLK